jgi:hypothetical protein
MKVEKECLIWKLWVKRGEIKVALESVAFKRKEGSVAMGFSKKTDS